MPHTNPGPLRAVTDERWVNADVVRILCAQVVFGFGWSLDPLNPKFLAVELHAGPDTIGRISAMGGLAGLLTVPIAGRWLDRLGRRVFFRAGSTLIALLSLGFLQVHEIGPLVYVLQGCVSAAFVLAFNASAALLTDYAPPQRLGQAIGWLGGANVAMNAVATMVAEPLAAHYGWSAVFELGVVFGAAAFALSFWMRPAPARPEPQLSAAASPSRLRANRSLIAILSASILMGGSFIAMFSFVQPYAISLGIHEVRNFYLGFTLAAVSGRVLLGSLGDRLGRRRVSIWMLAAYGLSGLLIRDLQPGWLALYGFAFGAAHGLLYPTLNAFVLEVLPRSRKGLGMVLFNGLFNLGSSVGGLGWGWLAKQYGYSTIYLGAAALAGVAIGVSHPGSQSIRHP